MAANPAHDKLLEKAMGGDQDALVELLDALGPEVRRRIASKLDGPWRSVLDADDVMQVTYMEACMKLDRFTGGGASGFLAWLSRLAENNLIDAIRSLESAKRPDPRKRIGPVRRSYEDSVVTLVEMLGSTSMTPSRVAGKAEAGRFLEAALARLPADYAKVIRLYDLEGRSIGEVASQLGRSEGAVYMLRARAHEQLKEFLGPAGRFFTNAP